MSAFGATPFAAFISGAAASAALVRVFGATEVAALASALSSKLSALRDRAYSAVTKL